MIIISRDNDFYGTDSDTSPISDINFTLIKTENQIYQ